MKLVLEEKKMYNNKIGGGNKRNHE